MADFRVEIPYDIGSEKGTLIGILHRHDHTKPSRGEARPVALILHGTLAHKDQLYHRKLAHVLPLDSFRFDFRHSAAGGESTSTQKWSMSNMGEDVLEMHTVIKFLRERFNYHVETLIGHSRGSLDSWTYFWDVEMRKREVIPNQHDRYILDPIPFYVSLAGRWKMQNVRLRYPKGLKDFETKGYTDWKVRVAGKDVTVQVTEEMTEAFAKYPIAALAEAFPSATDCLLLHGTIDNIVPVEDVFSYREKLQTDMQEPRTRPSSTELVLIQNGDHAYRGHFDEVVDVTCAWLAKRRAAVESKDVEASPAALDFIKRCPLAKAHPRSSSSQSGPSLSRKESNSKL